MTEPLVNRLLNDTYSHPDQLPVLQHALMRTWEHWQSHHRKGEPLRAGSCSFLTLSESSDPVIDLSHESLIRNSQRLSEWVNEETRSISIYRQLVQAALQYRDGNTGLLLDPRASGGTRLARPVTAQCSLG